MDQSKYLPKREECLPKGEKYREKQKGKIIVLGGVQADIGWW